MSGYSAVEALRLIVAERDAEIDRLRADAARVAGDAARQALRKVGNEIETNPDVSPLLIVRTYQAEFAAGLHQDGRRPAGRADQIPLGEQP